MSIEKNPNICMLSGKFTASVRAAPICTAHRTGNCKICRDGNGGNPFTTRRPSPFDLKYGINRCSIVSNKIKDRKIKPAKEKVLRYSPTPAIAVITSKHEGKARIPAVNRRTILSGSGAGCRAFQPAIDKEASFLVIGGIMSGVPLHW